MKNVLLIVCFLIFNECKSQNKDFSELAIIYSDFAAALKSDNDDILKDFCSKLAPNEETLNYMRENNLCYRGLPCKMDEKGIAISSIADNQYPNILRFRNKLGKEILRNLTHIDTTDYKSRTIIVNNIPINGTEEPIFFKSGNMVISYHLGEMVLINGKWSLFTKPGSSYRIIDE